MGAFLIQNWTTSLPLVIVVIAILVMEFKTRGKAGTSLTSQQAVFFANQKKSTIIDLRPAAMFKEGHIAKAKNFGEADLKADITPLKKQQDNPILVVCDTGMHALRFTHWLSKNGFSQVRAIRGGLQQWRKDNLPLVK